MRPAPQIIPVLLLTLVDRDALVVRPVDALSGAHQTRRYQRTPPGLWGVLRAERPRRRRLVGGTVRDCRRVDVHRPRTDRGIRYRRPASFVTK